MTDTFFDRPPGTLRESVEGREWLREQGYTGIWHRPSLFERGEFIGWDGEGITLETREHNYTLLANSVLGCIEPTDGTTLPTEQIFEFLLQTATQYPKAINVIFAGVYDFNMMLRDMSWYHLEILHRTGRVRWQQYQIYCIMGKRLSLRCRETDRHITLWDVFPFFQTSFVRTLEAWSIPVANLDNIKAQKLNRATFTAGDSEQVKEYCFQELAGLKLLMAEFRNRLADCDLNLARWDGPGAIAAKLFTQHHIKDHKQVCTEEVNRAAQYAYAGGRIELIRRGNLEGVPIYYYDIRSAYPDAISQLPSLAGATWRASKSRNPPVVPMSLYHIEWNINGEDPFFPGFFRTPTGNIHFPHSGTNWFWTPEYELFRDYYPDSFKVLSSLIFNGKPSGQPPFEWVRDLYNRRQEWKAEGNGGEKILKLGLNSLYGKMIQQVGYTERRGIPPYHQLEWGGYVTSYVRSKLFRAAYGNPGIIGFETDGILTRVPLDVPEGPRLGEWERETFSGICYVQSGVYWLRNTSGNWDAKYRGFDMGSISRELVTSAWANKVDTVAAKLTRFQGLSYSLQFLGRRKHWCRWITGDRLLNVSDCGSKRISLCTIGKCGACPECLSESLHLTTQYADIGTMHSMPYALVWKDGVPEYREEWLQELDWYEGSPIWETT